jgi:hypothetical protein
MQSQKANCFNVPPTPIPQETGQNLLILRDFTLALIHPSHRGIENLLLVTSPVGPNLGEASVFSPFICCSASLIP